MQGPKYYRVLTVCTHACGKLISNVSTLLQRKEHRGKMQCIALQQPVIVYQARVLPAPVALEKAQMGTTNSTCFCS